MPRHARPLDGIPCLDKVVRLTGGGTQTFTEPYGNGPDMVMLFKVY